MNRKYFALLLALSIGTIVTLAQDEKPSEKKEWQIRRDKGTNDCIVAKITAYDPQYPEQLGTYGTEKEAKIALESFKKTEDPNKAGFEMCTNK